MNTTFDDRKSAFEAKYANDQQLQFRVEARTAKMFGLWVAEQLGMGEAAAKTYAGDMVQSNLDEPGIEDMVDKALADLAARNVAKAAPELRIKIEEFAALAKEQVMTEETTTI